ncbi:chorismate synthase [Methanobacterium petrolearium]|uniref:chorismate synthase n=1 Tax=Methanobacterium petrolearium TaxID=710190 RepID=UPI001AE8B800|nr:chorismate synthase [Methanobacterium petrolearium]MBP1945228.1 chorismate synthase [Methanobacterium petrolearium]BDZ71162.1 chorismate synthase [Methanobacterium petrolearium]
MAGNTTGNLFRVTTFGSSHGTALGAVVDGCPAGLELSREDIQVELNRRRPGTSKITTSRGETDQVEILSGIFEGKTDGTPIAAVVYNKDADSSAYEPFRDKPRPGHGDYTWTAKYGCYDYRGGGRSSGRTTIGHVIGGAVAKKLIAQLNIKVVSHVTQVGDVKAKHVAYGRVEEYASKNSVRSADQKAAKLMENKILEAKEKGDSVGGVVEIIAFDVPAGIGEPVFDKLDADIAGALMGIGSVKGVEIGFGFKLAEKTASATNDEYYLEKGKIKTTTNTSGGIVGGISNGMPIVARIAVKPTPSISITQKTVDLKTMKETEIEIKGRHDPCICPRITAVAEASVAMVLVDHLLRSGFINSRHI